MSCSTSSSAELTGRSWCDKHTWEWTTTFPQALYATATSKYTFSSLQCSWMLHISYEWDNFLKLCLIGGAEKAETFYKLSIDEDKSVSTASASELNPLYVFRGNGTFIRNKPQSLNVKRNNHDFPLRRRSKIKITIHLTTIDIENVVTIPPSTFSVDFQAAIESNKEFQDLTLIVGGEDNKEEIKANKFMLMARSPVFARMFQADMKEKSSSVVEIPNASPRVFKIMLCYIYKGQFTDCLGLEDTISLMDIANQYELIHLKALCENLLAILLNTENAAHILLVAEKHFCPELKREAIDYITQDNEVCRAVLETEGWKEVRESHLISLVDEVLTSAVEPSSKKRKL